MSPLYYHDHLKIYYQSAGLRIPCIYIYIYIYILTHIHMVLCVYTYILMCTNINIHTYIYTFVHKYMRIDQVIGLMSRGSTNRSGDLGSIPCWVILKTQKMVLEATLLNTQHIRQESRVKWRNPENGGEPSPIPRCCSYWKRSLQVTLDWERVWLWQKIQQLARVTNPQGTLVKTT